MKILWASNWSAQSSYALQSQLFVPRIKALGHDITIFELSNGTRRTYESNGVKVLSCIADPLGNDVIQDYAVRAKADAVITLIDVWRFNADIWSKVPWYPYCPVDHTPVPPGVVGALNGARKVIAMSKFGVEELKKVGCEALYAPLAYDPKIWYPADKDATRAKLGIPDDAFWVTFIGVNDSNPSRKGIPELLTAWQMFVTKHPDAVLYMHTAMHGNIAISGAIGGVKIDYIMSTLHLTDRQVKMVDQFEYRTGIPTSKLAAIVAASDVVVLPSRGEGFGLPLIEAQAVGTPVITTKFAAQQELVKAGWMVEGESEWSYQDSFVLKPGILSLYEAFENAYQQRNNKHLRQIAAEGVTDYQVDNVVAKYWKPALNTLAETTLEALKAS